MSFLRPALAIAAGLVLVGFIAKPPTIAEPGAAPPSVSDSDKKEREAVARRVESMSEQIELFCEKATRENLSVPSSARFDQSSVRHDPAPERKSWRVYERFTYKNPMNATLDGAILCSVDTSDNMLRLVDLKIGRP